MPGGRDALHSFVWFGVGVTNMAQTAASAFWQFSLDLYARPHVSTLCLALQDKHGFDVNLLLFCLWSAQVSKVALDSSEISELLDRISPLNDNLVHPVRSARRWVRLCIAGSPETDPAVGLVKVYASLKAVELQSERQVQSALAGLSRQTANRDRTTQQSAASANLCIYRQVIAAPDAAAVLLSQLVFMAFAPPIKPGVSLT